MQQSNGFRIPPQQKSKGGLCESGTVRIVILGNFTSQWMASLGSSSSIWQSMPLVGEVVIVGEKENFQFPPPQNSKICLSIIVPLLEQHIRMLPKQLPEGFVALKPPNQSLEILRNKACFSDFMEAKGFSCYIPRRIREIRDTDFPIIVKKQISMAGHGVAIVRSSAELHYLLSQEGWDGSRLVLQSYLKSRTEYVTHAICVNGCLVWNTSFAYEIIGDHPIKTEFTEVRTTSTPTIPMVKAVLEEVLKNLNFQGPICANYKLIGEKPVFLEINPRFGGSMMWFSHRLLLAEAIKALISAAIAQHSSRLLS